MEFIHLNKKSVNMIICKIKKNKNNIKLFLVISIR